MNQVYIDDIKIQDSEKYDVSKIQGNLYISFAELLNYQPETSEYFCFIIYDSDSPYPSPYNNSSPFIHSLIVNIPYNDFFNGDTIFSYLPPTLPSNSKEHNYHINLYQQKYKINPDLISIYQRNNFNLAHFVKSYQLNIYDTVSFIVFSSDKKDYFISNTELDNDEQKYCRCVLDVASKQPEECISEHSCFEKKEYSLQPWEQNIL